MEEPIERSSIIARIKGWISPGAEYEEEELSGYEAKPPRSSLRLQQNHPYHVAVRKELNSIEDARIAGDGLKEGSQQIINLVNTEPALRERVIDFLTGVVYALEGRVEKIGDNIFLFAPRQAIVDMTPGQHRYRTDPN
ncbi:MAG: cell division protein SepF [bacterium]|jgi:cell division inhibitor SepF